MTVSPTFTLVTAEPTSSTQPAFSWPIVYGSDGSCFAPIQVVANDTLAYDYGTSKVYYTNDAGEPVELEDTYLVILKKDASGGQWQIHREVASGVVE